MQVKNQLTKLNFGMAITSTPRAKNHLEENLTQKCADEVQKLIKSEQNNPEDVFITTKTKYGFDFTKGCAKYEYLEVIAGNRTYRPMNYFIYPFSPSRAIVSAIKDAVKHTQEIAKTRKINEEINNALKELVLKNKLI